MKELGWNVKVVVPSSQKSWIGKAFLIAEVTKGWYYYPKDPDGHGEWSEASRPLKEGEIAEWILLDGTPATCANISINNLYPNQLDLVLSGPNMGRNTSTAFSMSSGTIGAALSASLTGLRSIAISYGIVEHPSPPVYLPHAHDLGLKIISKLWSDWGVDQGGSRVASRISETSTAKEGDREVDLYTINVPLIPQLQEPGSVEVLHTTTWRNQYGRLFKALKPAADTPSGAAAPPEGPDAAPPKSTQPTTTVPPSTTSSSDSDPLRFKFAPDMSNLIPKSSNEIPEGTDAWAIHNGYASVTALRASFAEPSEVGSTSGRKMKL